MLRPSCRIQLGETGSLTKTIVEYHGPSDTVCPVLSDPPEPDKVWPERRDFGDISLLTHKVKSQMGINAQTQSQLNVLNPTKAVDFLDIGACADAFKGEPYPFDGPAACSPYYCKSELAPRRTLLRSEGLPLTRYLLPCLSGGRGCECAMRRLFTTSRDSDRPARSKPTFLPDMLLESGVFHLPDVKPQLYTNEPLDPSEKRPSRALSPATLNCGI